MNTLARAALVLAALALAGCAASGTCGCEDGCLATASCTDPTPECPDDPASGDVAPDCGVWVSATLGDDANDGSQAAPVRTLQRGINLAAEGAGRVYVCAETFFEPAVLPSGVSLFGGFFCQNGWRRAQAGARATIAPVHDVIPLRVVTGPGESFVMDFEVRAADASDPGGSSIAAWAEQGALVELRRVGLEAGDGADGADGAHGGLESAAEGPPGVGGVAACLAEIGAGGPAPANDCDDGPSIGGDGGDGSEAAAQGGESGLPDYRGGAPGLGEEQAPTCTPGQNGSDGAEGVDAVGAQAGGELVASGYLGPAGEAGTAGARAQGGGGGGASFGGAGCGPLPPGGAGGGSGGAGGCGGRPGLGGGAGGASIALASRSTGVRLRDALLVAGNGGRGGRGGAGQAGGAGGLPGGGGAPYGGSPPVGGGCAGGFGGRGGDGGHGAGGAGGPSAAVAHTFGSAPEQLGNVELTFGKGGAGGLGGNPAQRSGGGEAGQGAQVLLLGP